MSFLKKIFGNSEKSVESINQQNQTIYDLFKIDLKNLPDETFFLSGIEKNTTGIAKLFFKSKPEYLECGLFSKIDIIQHSHENYNVLFESDIDFNFLKLEGLINDLYSIYGKDDKMKGRLISSESNEINNHYWSGRNYFEVEKYPNKPSICLYEEEGSIHLTVYNPKQTVINTDEIVPSAKFELKGMSLLEKLKEFNIDFYNGDQEGTPLEFTIEEDINGITSKQFIPLENHFFSSLILMNYKNGNKEMFFIKNTATEKDFKTLLDKTSVLLGKDVVGRSTMSMDDLNIIRGALVEEDDVYGIRHWIDIHSEYDIVITHDEEEKDLFLRIYRS